MLVGYLNLKHVDQFKNLAAIVELFGLVSAMFEFQKVLLEFKAEAVGHFPAWVVNDVVAHCLPNSCLIALRRYAAGFLAVAIRESKSCNQTFPFAGP